MRLDEKQMLAETAKIIEYGQAIIQQYMNNSIQVQLRSYINKLVNGCSYYDIKAFKEFCRNNCFSQKTMEQMAKIGHTDEKYKEMFGRDRVDSFFGILEILDKMFDI